LIVEVTGSQYPGPAWGYGIEGSREGIFARERIGGFEVEMLVSSERWYLRVDFWRFSLLGL
jgi:hypothetical protein